MLLRLLARIFRRRTRPIDPRRPSAALPAGSKSRPSIEAPVAPPKPLRVRRRGTLPPLPPMKQQARR